MEIVETVELLHKDTEEKINLRISRELKLPAAKVKDTVALLDEGNTVPFIARYRKEMTGGLSDEEIRLLEEKMTLYRNLEQRREDVVRLIDAQGALTPELESSIISAGTVTELDDIYLPYRPKRRTRATIAREKGLQPLSEAIMGGKCDPATEALKYIDPEKELHDTETVLKGVSDIIAEMVAEDAAVRQGMRKIYLNVGIVTTKKRKNTEDNNTYDDYHDYNEPLSKIKSHRILAINRGYRENILDLDVSVEEESAMKLILAQFLPQFDNSESNSACIEFFQSAAKDGFRRLLHPSMEREVWQYRFNEAVDGAIIVFKENLKKRLLVPPMRQRRVMGLDPGYRTGCKLACVSETGELLQVATIYPTPPRSDLERSKATVVQMLEKHRINCIAIGNGTASRESEDFIAAIINEHGPDMEYTIVNEAGASVYSASPLAQKEFSELDVAERSAVSIARRLQDPLAELVKIDPKSIGVGQYQHDMPAQELDEALSGTVESCVNKVGVDLNTASAPLLAYVAGINKTIASRIVDYRNELGTITARKQLLTITGLGPKAYKQCAGFLRIPDSEDYLERSAIHPESYKLAKSIIKELKLDPKKLGQDDAIPKISAEQISELAEKLDAGEPTITDILSEFRKPGRDPREDLPKPVFLKSVTNFEDLKPGMVLMGIVRNIVDFGAFVDIGVHQDGLVHISEIADKYIKHPLEALSIEEVVSVKILSVDISRKRIALSIKQAVS